MLEGVTQQWLRPVGSVHRITAAVCWPPCGLITCRGQCSSRSLPDTNNINLVTPEPSGVLQDVSLLLPVDNKGTKRSSAEAKPTVLCSERGGGVELNCTYISSFNETHAPAHCATKEGGREGGKLKRAILEEKGICRAAAQCRH